MKRDMLRNIVHAGSLGIAVSVASLLGGAMPSWAGEMQQHDSGSISSDDTGWKPVRVSSSKESPSYQAASDAYRNFLTQNPIVRIKTRTVNLEIDKAPNPVGSIVVKFISPQTCSEVLAENCLTTILKYDDADQKWHEIWSHKTRQLYMGGADYDSTIHRQEGAWFHTLYTTDGLKWRWVNTNGDFYEPTPIGNSFTAFSETYKPVPAPRKMVDFVTESFGWPQDGEYMSQRLDIDHATNKPAYIVYPTRGPFCGTMGCTATLLMAGRDGGSYRPAINDKGTFMYNSEGWIIKGSGEESRHNDLIVRNGLQVDGYIYSPDLNHYSLIQTSYKSKDTLLP